MARVRMPRLDAQLQSRWSIRYRFYARGTRCEWLSIYIHTRFVFNACSLAVVIYIQHNTVEKEAIFVCYEHGMVEELRALALKFLEFSATQIHTIINIYRRLLTHRFCTVLQLHSALLVDSSSRGSQCCLDCISLVDQIPRALKQKNPASYQHENCDSTITIKIDQVKFSTSLLEYHYAFRKQLFPE